MPQERSTAFEPHRPRASSGLRSGRICTLSLRPIELRRPLELLERLRPLGHPWMLESASFRRGAGHCSFVGADPMLVLRSRAGRHAVESPRGELPGWVQRAAQERRAAEHGDVFDVLRRLSPPRPSLVEGLEGGARLPDFAGGWVGFLSYELARVTEPVRFEAHDDLGLPDLALLLVDRLIVHDAKLECCWAVGLGIGEDGDEEEALDQAIAAREAIAWAVDPPPELRTQSRRMPTRSKAATSSADAPAANPRADSLDRDAHRRAVARIIEEIAAGEVYQANLTMRISRHFDGDPLALYTELRRCNPAPFAAYFEFPELAMVGSSPERFLSVDVHGRARSEPIKGTRPRGQSPDEDQALAEELSASEKDRAENLMIVDLVRNDLGKVCRTGSVEVPSLMRLESYATVHQLVSTVEGVLRSDRDSIDAIRATFPPGSMTGAPKIAAMRLIDRLEPVCRGIYSGAVGYLDLRGNTDWAVVIRSILLKDGKAHSNAGGGIVSDSDPDEEYAEARDKAAALLAALDALER